MRNGDLIYVLIEHRVYGPRIRKGIIVDKKKYGKTCFVQLKDKETIQTHIKNCFYTLPDTYRALLEKLKKEICEEISDMNNKLNVLKSKIDITINLISDGEKL